jgi:hypothetical protein
MTLISRTVLVAAGAATLIGSTPAFARDRHRDGIDAGDVIAGALIIGGIAAIASAASNDNRGRYDDRHDSRYDNRSYGYNNSNYDSRWAVDQCVRAAQRDASRYGRARVTDVTRISRSYGGYEIRGRLVVEERDYGRGYDRRGYGNQWDRYGYNYDRYNDGYDKGRFTCVTRYDRVAGLRVSGLG